MMCRCAALGAINPIIDNTTGNTQQNMCGNRLAIRLKLIALFCIRRILSYKFIISEKYLQMVACYVNGGVYNNMHAHAALLKP
jgi:hypothetical protein